VYAIAKPSKLVKGRFWSSARLCGRVYSGHFVCLFVQHLQGCFFTTVKRGTNLKMMIF